MTTTIEIPYFSNQLRVIALAASSLLLHAGLSAQKFQYDYGYSLTEVGTSLVAIPGGYAIGGKQDSNVLNIMTNPNGDMILDGRHQPVQGGLTVTPHSMRRTSNGGLIATGEIDGGPAGIEVFLAYYAPNGDLWPTGAYGPDKYLLYKGDQTGMRQGTRVIEMSEGGFAVITNIDPATNGQGVLFTTDANGLLLCWTSYSYGGYPVRFHDLCQDTDGTIVIVGTVDEPFASGRHTLMLRTD